MNTISTLNTLIAHAKSSGFVEWANDLETIQEYISQLILERGILEVSNTSGLSGMQSETQFAIVSGVGLYQYLYLSSSPTNPVYPTYTTAGYYWLQIANYKQLPLALASLSDVNISSPTNLQAIMYNSSNSKWENGDLLPTKILSPTNQQVLSYNSTYKAFVNRSPSVTTVGANIGYNATIDDDFILINDSSTDHINLPNSPSNLANVPVGKKITVAYTDGGLSNVTTLNGVSGSVCEISPSASPSFGVVKYSVTLQYSGSEWIPISGG